MVLLGDEAQLEARFGSFGDSSNLDARSVHGLRQTYHRPRNCLEMVFVLVQDSCTVCTKRTIGLDII